MCAYLVVLDGSKVAPIFNRLERELEAMREKNNTIGRAKRLLENLAAPMQRDLLLTSQEQI
ncbi:hypothetical protein [Bradyrhizobium sp. SEMIA]|uniref:hypothetical protein n=1 Tax=Bradyrhizobium sp. SEMIA TaxID=2597515 RepID=UPI002240B198|nr:hypothetical protein [Bradyrhizobium sp. SEMIA]